MEIMLTAWTITPTISFALAWDLGEAKDEFLWFKDTLNEVTQVWLDLSFKDKC